MKRIMRYTIVVVILGLLIGCGEVELPNNPPAVSHEGMALIPGGNFEMGDHFNEGSSDERPVHTADSIRSGGKTFHPKLTGYCQYLLYLPLLGV